MTRKSMSLGRPRLRRRSLSFDRSQDHDRDLDGFISVARARDRDSSPSPATGSWNEFGILVELFAFAKVRSWSPTSRQLGDLAGASVHSE